LDGDYCADYGISVISFLDTSSFGKQRPATPALALPIMHGYSSSSESDDDYTYRKHKGTVAATANPNDANKKKKKRKVPPQQSINRIWKRFSNKKFNKALAVLPFDPVLPPTISERSNELLSAGYERAAEECRRKVKKIIQECRRVNMRYRDPGWDLVSATPFSGTRFRPILSARAGCIQLKRSDLLLTYARYRTGTSRWKKATVSTAWVAPSSI
jgi:hypothetical protein